VFAQAKAAAKKTTSLSNKKQIALGFLMYLNDYDGNYPMIGYMKDGNGIIGPGGTGTVLFGVFDAPQPYIKNLDIFIDPADPEAIYWSDTPQNANTVLGRISLDWTSYSEFVYSSTSPNFRVFEDTAIVPPLGNANPVVNESSLEFPSETTLIFDARYVAMDQENLDAPEGGLYRNPPGPFGQHNFPGTPRHNGTLTAAFADGHGRALKASEDFGGTVMEFGEETKVYNLPYDVNGIPGQVAEFR
jgi:prepilin-type processing-associated H-X9-DG protein